MPKKKRPTEMLRWDSRLSARRLSVSTHIKKIIFWTYMTVNKNWGAWATIFHLCKRVSVEAE